MAKAQRYAQLIALVRETKPTTIIEIGVWNGRRAMKMAGAALAHQERVHYTGFDLFQDATEETNREELNHKRNNSLSTVHRNLQAFGERNPGFTFELVKGNTRETLGVHYAEFVFIDGGHSVETIRSDYEAVKASPVVVFDDYYACDHGGRCPDIRRFGANQIIDELSEDENVEVEILPSEDPVRDGGIVCLAVVRRVGEDEDRPAE